MRKLRALGVRVRNLVCSSQAEEEFAAEMEAHLSLEIEDGIRHGLSEEEARRQALIRSGGLDQAKTAYRERRGLPFLETLAQDVVYGLRALRKNPGFAFVVVLTLALGTGANTALFSIIHAVLFDPLPYPHPEELVTVDASKPNFFRGSISYLNFRDWQRENHSLATLAVFRYTGFTLTGAGDAERVRALYVSSDFLPVLGANPTLGRIFAPGEDEPGRSPVAIISAGLWARKFGSRTDVLRKTLLLDGNSFTIIGVLPAEFDQGAGYFGPKEVYVPIGQWPNTALHDRAAGLGIHGIARLKPGISFAQAQADMYAVSDHLADVYPAEDHGIRAQLLPLSQASVGDMQPLLLVLLAAVSFVLLIACVNVANLLLARSDGRAQEFAVRFALGAGRVRVIRQVLTESILLSFVGGLMGFLLAAWGTHAALKLIPTAMPRAGAIHVNGPVLVFTLVLSLAVGILFGLLPALKISPDRLQGALKEGGRGSIGAGNGMQNSLVIFEVALALVLLVGAGLMIRSLAVLFGVDPGFDPKGAVLFNLAMPPSLRGQPEESMVAYYREVHRRMKETPGVQAVSLSSGSLLMTSSDDEQLFWLENEPKPANANDMHWSLEYTVEPDYLNVMRIPLLRGRFFTDTDNQVKAPLSVVIDDVFAKKYFGDQDPVGKHLNMDGFGEKATIVGVVGHVLHWGLADDVNNSLRAQIYIPFLKQNGIAVSLGGNLATNVVVRVNSDNTATIAALQNSLRQMDKEQFLWGVSAMKDIVAQNKDIAGRRFSMILLSVFAALALVLASVGIYGVISYLVGQRTHEIGVRMALGADRQNILRWILKHGGKLALTGSGFGLVAALSLSRLMTSLPMLYGVRSYDLWTISGVTVLLLFVALAASGIPAVRAMRIEPMRALRNE